MKKKSIGRPPKGDKKRVRLPVRIQIKLKEKLEQLAEEKGLDRGQLAADMLEKSIRRAKLPPSLR